MASKIFVLCALVCAIQGLNAALVRPGVLPVQSLESELYRDAMSRFETLESEYAAIIDKFENVVLNTETEAPEAEFAGFFDDIMESVQSFDENDMTEGAANIEIVRKCIKEQAPNFRKFVQEMREKVAKARVQLRQLIVDTFSPYIQKAREAFRILASEIAQFPVRMWECIQKMDFLKALEVIKKTRDIVAEQANEIGRNLREARTKFPIIREKAMQMREELENQARAGLEVIREAIRECIANGGPKVHLAAAPMSPVVPAEQVSTLIAPADAVYEA